MNRRRYMSLDDQLAGITVGIVLFLLGGFIFLLIRSFKRNIRPYTPIGLDSDTIVSPFSIRIRPMTVSDIVTAGMPLTVLLVSLATSVLISRFVAGSATLLSVRLAGLILALLTLLLIALIFSRSGAWLSLVFAAITAFGGILFLLCALFIPVTLTGAIPGLLVFLVAIAAFLTLIWANGTREEVSAVAFGLATLGTACSLVELLWVSSSQAQPPVFLSLAVVSLLGAVLLGYLAGDIALPHHRGTAIVTLLLVGILATVFGIAAGSFTRLPSQTIPLLLLLACVASGVALAIWYAPQPKSPYLPEPLFFSNSGGKTPHSITIFPKPGQLEAQKTQDLITALMSKNRQLTLSIVSEAGQGITWRVSDPSNRLDVALLESDIKAHHSGVVLAETTEHYHPAVPLYRQVIVFGLANDYAAPLASVDTLKAHDPLSTITQRMDSLSAEKHERITYQVMVVTKTATAKGSAAARLVNNQIHPLSGITRNPDDPIAGFDIAVLNTKLQQNLYHCILTVTMESADRSRFEALAQVAGDIEQVAYPGYNHPVRQFMSAILELTQPDQMAQNSAEALVEAWKQDRDPNWRSALTVLSAGEIATLWHLPTDAFAAPSIVWGTTTVPEDLTDPTNAVLLGEIVRAGAAKQPVYLKTVDRRRHHYIAGMPGMGKSTLMHSLIQQDIQNGDGVVVIDPHGTLIDAILAKSIPAKRANDVVLLECGRTDRPVPINPFRLPPEVMVDQAYNFVLYAMQRVYSSIWLEGQTQSYIQQLVQLLLTDPESTPQDIDHILDPEDSTYLHKLLGSLKDNPRVGRIAAQGLRQFWTRFSKYARGKKQEIALPIHNRTAMFLGTPQLISMTCHPRTIDFQGYLREKKIVLINLAGSAVFSEVDSLATLFLSGFLLAAFSLGAIPDDAPPHAYAYVDELERMTGAPVPTMVAEARKFGLSLIVSNQTLAQLPTDVLNGILGTVETRCIFRLGMTDAQKFAPEFGPDVTVADIRNLGQWRMAVRTSANGRPVTPFILNTVEPRKVSDPVSPETLRQRATDTLMSREEVENWLEKRYPDIPPEEAEEKQPPPNTRKPRSPKQPPQAKDMPEIE